MSAIQSIGIVGQPNTLPIDNQMSQTMPQPEDSSASQPAVIVSLSSAAITASKGPDLGEVSVHQIDDALSSAVSANGAAYLFKFANWGLLEAKFGKAIADRDKQGAWESAISYEQHALSSASDLGIPAHASVSPDDIKNGAEFGHFTVGNFSFTDGKSKYQVTNGPGYTLVGTKDGQPWQTWLLRDPDDVPRSDSAALNALTLLNTRSQSVMSGHPRSPLNVSA